MKLIFTGFIMHFSEVIMWTFRIFGVYISDDLIESRSGWSYMELPLRRLGGFPESNRHSSSRAAETEPGGDPS